jgi:hypothetical protein
MDTLLDLFRLLGSSAGMYFQWASNRLSASVSSAHREKHQAKKYWILMSINKVRLIHDQMKRAINVVHSIFLLES